MISRTKEGNISHPTFVDKTLNLQPIIKFIKTEISLKYKYCVNVVKPTLTSTKKRKSHSSRSF